MPILETLGTSIHHMGASGCGSAAKLANQVILGGTLAVCCEAFVAATKYGIDPGQLLDVLMGSSSGGKVMERNIGTMILNNDFDAQFSLDLLTKDLALGTKQARRSWNPNADRRDGRADGQRGAGVRSGRQRHGGDYQAAGAVRRGRSAEVAGANT